MSNNIFIDLTEEMVNKGWTVNWEFNAIDPTTSSFLKYNHCTTYTECREVYANVAIDVDGNGAWNYRLDNLEIGGIYNSELNITDGLFIIDSSGETLNTSLKSFNVDLPNLTDGSAMFAVCQNLTSFSSDLSNLTNGMMMFAGSGLTSFSSDLPKLTNGMLMFYTCTNLTSFSSDLSRLSAGLAMFGIETSNCTKLDLASVQNIANTINTASSALLHIGISSSIQDNADLETALAAIRAKGWTVIEIYA